MVDERAQGNERWRFYGDRRPRGIRLIAITALAVLAPGFLFPFLAVVAGLFRCPLLLGGVGLLRLMEVGIVRHGVVIHAWVIGRWRRIMRRVVHQLADGFAA